MLFPHAFAPTALRALRAAVTAACSAAAIAGFIAQPTAASAWAYGNNDSFSNRFSFANGSQYLVWHSFASNFVAGDTNGVSDVFRQTYANGSLQLVSQSTSGTIGNGPSADPCADATGNLVVFASTASNLVAGDTNSQSDIFLRDMSAGTTTRISVSSSGAQAVGGLSQQPYITPDGTKVVYRSAATNLVTSDTNGQRDIFMYTVATGATTRLSVSSSGGEGNGESATPQLSTDGRYLVFESSANNLVSGDTNGARDLFIKDVTTGYLDRVTSGIGSSQANNNSFGIGISANAMLIAYQSDASNLVTSDTNAVRDCFLFNVLTSATTRISVSTSGTQLNNTSYSPVLSADGQRAAFYTDATDAFPNDTNGANQDVMLYEVATGSVSLMSGRQSDGSASNGFSALASFSADGTKLAFASTSSDLTTGDTNGRCDVFVRNIPGAVTTVPVGVSALSIE